MNKKHNLVSIFVGIAVLVVVQVFSSPTPVFRYLAPAYVLLVAGVTWYNSWHLKRVGKYNPWILLRGILLFVALFSIFLTLPNSFLRGLFLISSTFVVAFFEFFIGNFSESITLNETLLMAFGFFMALAASDWYFPKFQLLWTAAVLVFSFLLTRSVFEFLPQPNSVKISSSAILAFFCSQIFWVLSLLPFHFSAGGLMLFNIFYFCLILNYYYLINTLSYKKVQMHLILLVVGTLIILTATPWRVLT